MIVKAALASTVVCLISLSGVSCFKCLPGHLATYTLKLKTYWDEQTFPKQYPQWRPPAQWSKTIGYVHGEGSGLWRLGEAVTPGLKDFVETGDSQTLEQEIGNRSANVLDTILVPQITQGVGDSEATIFVDGNHTKISVLTKIVPSPDWFIGLDSLDLCREGQFIDSLAVKVDPLDAGTDNGFTFTSPNWPTEPQGVVFKISSNYPPHPAGSFNYPHLPQLPTLAQFFLTKNKEYELANGAKDKVIGFITDNKKNINNINNNPAITTGQDEANNVVITLEKSDTTTRTNNNNNNNIDSSVAKYEYSIANSDEGKSMEIIDFVPLDKTKKASDRYGLVSNEVVVQPPNPPKKKTVNLTKNKKGFRGYHASSAPQDFLKKRYKSEYLSKAQDVVFHRNLNKEAKKNVLQSILNSYRSSGSSGKAGLRGSSRRKRRFRRRKHRRHKEPRSCKVSSWGAWSACSKSCGIGESVRTRTILTHPRHNGTPCPKLREYKWCGSARNCNSGYFNW